MERPYETLTIRELRRMHSSLSKDLDTTDEKYKETLTGIIKEVAGEIEQRSGFKMTTYKLIVPIKCKTIHKAWKMTCKISKGIIVATILSAFGFLNGLVFYMSFHSEEVRNYALSNSGSLIPGAEYILPPLMIIVDIFCIISLLNECNINFELGCIKEGGEE